MEAFLYTDCGGRARQEDGALFCGDVVLSSGIFLKCKSDDIYSVFCVCDGIGGLESGHEFSKYICENILKFSSGVWMDRTSAVDAVDQIQQKVCDVFNVTGGSTMTVVCISGRCLSFVNAGNSRAYLLRDNRLVVLSHDHTYAHNLVQCGVIDHSELATHYLASYLSFGIGTAFCEDWDKSRIEFESIFLQDNDVVILCTDGYYAGLPEDRFISFVKNIQGMSFVDMKERFDKDMVDDNMTVIVVNC
ncbi:MAG: PP2C family serine/threonine-protein phosphatase [Desulfovibrionaceae bacterium]